MRLGVESSPDPGFVDDLDSLSRSGGVVSTYAVFLDKRLERNV